MISQELETHGTVYQPPGHSAQLPSNIINHGLLTQDQFLQLLRRAKVTTELNPGHSVSGPMRTITILIYCANVRGHLCVVSDLDLIYSLIC